MESQTIFPLASKHHAMRWYTTSSSRNLFLSNSRISNDANSFGKFVEPECEVSIHWRRNSSGSPTISLKKIVSFLVLSSFAFKSMPNWSWINVYGDSIAQQINNNFGISRYFASPLRPLSLSLLSSFSFHFHFRFNRKAFLSLSVKRSLTHCYWLQRTQRRIPSNHIKRCNLFSQMMSFSTFSTLRPLSLRRLSIGFANI